MFEFGHDDGAMAVRHSSSDKRYMRPSMHGTPGVPRSRAPCFGKRHRRDLTALTIRWDIRRRGRGDEVGKGLWHLWHGTMAQHDRSNPGVRTTLPKIIGMNKWIEYGETTVND